MKKLARMMTMGGFGLLAALAVGAGPVQAAPVDSAPATRPGPRQIQLREGVQIAGYYRTAKACQRSGRFGERNAYWDVHKCAPVRVGLRRGAWALQAVSYDDWDRLGFAVPLSAVCEFPVQYRPTWVGQFRPGRPGYVHPYYPRYNRPGHGKGHDRPDYERPDYDRPGQGRPDHGNDYGRDHGGDYGRDHGRSEERQPGKPGDRPGDRSGFGTAKPPAPSTPVIPSPSPSTSTPVRGGHGSR
ncbi:hypothetical protein [Actinoplanes philippinensis]|uniref:hypothetical protein n=1 Tax=Actinoplanes philippinensis TaxID=35752 RepID=UPI003405167B